MREEDRLMLGEFIGLETRIVRSSQRNLVGFSGKIVDEMKNVFIIKTEKGEKKIPKSGNVFAFKENGKEIEIEGDKICYRPEDRLKRLK